MSGTGELAAVLLPAGRPRVSNVIHPTPPIPFHETYEFIKAIGAGGEGDCDLFTVTGTGRYVAVKTVVRRNPHTNYLHEADILALIPKHPRIIEVIGVFQGEDQPVRIVLPLYSGGDIAALVKRFSKFNARIPEAFAWHAFVQLCDGLNHLHTNGVMPILHRDLKPENVLLEFSDNGVLFDNIKIIDFGMSTNNMQPHLHRGGTTKYQPPESPIASKAADIYAMGGCIHFMLTGKAPKPDCPDIVHAQDRHSWYSNSPPLVQRLVHDEHTDFSADKQPLSHSDASRATLDHPTPLPSKGYSPLLEYWVLRVLDPEFNTRATTADLLEHMAADADKQIDFYKKWVAACRKRPLCNFAYPEPPSKWRPE